MVDATIIIYFSHMMKEHLCLLKYSSECILFLLPAQALVIHL